MSVQVIENLKRPGPALMCFLFILVPSRKHSIISDLFEGIERSQVTCRQCGRESFKYDPFMSVLIEIGRCAPDVPESMWTFICWGVVPFESVGKCDFGDMPRLERSFFSLLVEGRAACKETPGSVRSVPILYIAL